MKYSLLVTLPAAPDGLHFCINEVAQKEQQKLLQERGIAFCVETLVKAGFKMSKILASD